jgi:outer membrane protein TolC
MNLKLYYFIALSVLIIGSSSSASDSLSLQDCIVLAKESNLSLKQSAATLEKAHAGVIDAYSSYYPSLDLSSSYRNEEGFAGVREGRYSTSLSLQYSVFRGGYVRAASRIAKADVGVAQANYQFTENEVVLAVREAFFRILQKQDQSALVDDVLERRREDLVIIELKYEAGRESSPAAQEAQANLLQAEYEKMKAEEELTLAQVELNLLLGRPTEAEVAIRYEDEPVEFPSPQSMIEVALADRPEMHAERARREAIDAQISQARSSYWPTVSLSGSYGWQGDTFLEQQGGWSAGVNISLPIFEGFSRKAKVTQANLSLREQDLKLEELEDAIAEELERDYSNWELARKNLDVSETSLNAAREMYQLTRLQYEQGLTSYLFLQQKESALTQAEYNHVNALFNLRTSAATLEKAWGGRN